MALLRLRIPALAGHLDLSPLSWLSAANKCFTLRSLQTSSNEAQSKGAESELQGPLQGIKVFTCGTCNRRNPQNYPDIKKLRGTSSRNIPTLMRHVNLQVLDLGQVVAGNFCGGLLGYFGADVIKVSSLRGPCHSNTAAYQGDIFMDARSSFVCR